MIRFCKNNFLMCFAFILLCGAGMVSRASTEPGSLAHFIQMVSGRWDNIAQVEEGIEAGLDTAHQHIRYAMNYVPVEAPELQGVLVAIQSYGVDGLAGEMSRVALHRFRDENGKIVHEFVFPYDKETLGDLRKDLAPLGKLKESDIRLNTGCRLYWQWVDDHYEGATREGACITSSYTENAILVEGQGSLYVDRLIRHDRNYALDDGTEIMRDGGATPEIFDRIE